MARKSKKNKNLHEAMLWQKERNGIRCFLCARRCFIAKGKKGFCQVRVNKGNVLYTLNYGKLIAVNVDPVEKKPLFHFYPGAKTLSIAAKGCNFRCQFCDNWQISQTVDAEAEGVEGDEYTPEDVVELAEKHDCKMISYTYTEPTIFFEFAYETAKLAHRSNILNTFVTNGYMTEDAIKKISKYLDAVTVDIKASADPEFYKKFMSVPNVEPIFDAMKRLKKQRIFMEITNLIVPQVGDNINRCRRLAERINANLGTDIPFHVLQFFPNYQLKELPITPVETLERCAQEARRAGLRYVYIGNVPGHEEANTYCYNCRTLLVERDGANIRSINLVKDRCPQCGQRINIIRE
jgi:pyruvate formate lyase activating enzyme